MQTWLPALAAFLGTSIEAAEALTIILAVGMTTGWTTALRGTGAALALLASIVAILGPLLVAYVPLDALRTVVGIVLLLLGLDWLRKGILRFSGRKALRDETAAFERAEAALRAERELAERAGFALAFKSTLLEGLECVIIVITIGASGGAARLALASAGAAAAIVLVVAAGLALRRPLAALSDTALKTFAGVLLTSFGTFWTGEGLGLSWWFGDLSIPLLAAFYFALGVVGVAALRRRAGEAAH